MTQLQAPIFGITGWKNSGKTTLVVRVVEELTRRGLTVSTVKHAHHSFDIDQAGTDSFKHRAAGAQEVALVSGTRWALMHELRDEDEPTLADILPRLSPCDIVIVEGFKRERHQKIECRRIDSKGGAPIFVGDDTIVALATDHPVSEAGRPVFDIDAVAEIADFILEQTGLDRRDPQTAAS